MSMQGPPRLRELLPTSAFVSGDLAVATVSVRNLFHNLSDSRAETVPR